MWTTLKDTGRTMVELFALGGIGLVKAGNARVQGWIMMKEFLKLRRDGKPGLVIFEDCKTLIRSIPALLHSEKNPSDVATEPHELTHAPDAIRYLCVYRLLGATRDKDDAEDEAEPYDETMRGGAVSGSYLGC